MKKLLILIALLTIIVNGVVLAQDANDSTDDNWCFEGNPWGDGRCDDPDPNIAEYNWVAGWCHAQVENGNFEGNFYQCMGIGNGAANDHYSTSGSLGCQPYNSVSSPGVLLNDSGSGLSVISNTPLVGLGTGANGVGIGKVTMNADGSFEILVDRPDMYRFSYTSSDGTSATVTIDICHNLGI